jgi:hypothetical protein
MNRFEEIASARLAIDSWQSVPESVRTGKCVTSTKYCTYCKVNFNSTDLNMTRLLISLFPELAG